MLFRSGPETRRAAVLFAALIILRVDVKISFTVKCFSLEEDCKQQDRTEQVHAEVPSMRNKNEQEMVVKVFCSNVVPALAHLN